MSTVLANRAVRLKEPDVNKLWKVEGEFPPVPYCFSLFVPVLLSCIRMCMLMGTISVIMQKGTARSLFLKVPLIKQIIAVRDKTQW